MRVVAHILLEQTALPRCQVLLLVVRAHLLIVCEELLLLEGLGQTHVTRPIHYVKLIGDMFCLLILLHIIHNKVSVGGRNRVGLCCVCSRYIVRVIDLICSLTVY